MIDMNVSSSELSSFADDSRFIKIMHQMDVVTLPLQKVLMKVDYCTTENNMKFNCNTVYLKAYDSIMDLEKKLKDIQCIENQFKNEPIYCNRPVL